MSEEPKPCPFCGGGPTVFYGPQRENVVRCSDCKAMTGGETSGAAAVSTWNRRAYHDAEIAKLREALETAQSWLERWAPHAGRCRGGIKCECGLTNARYEARAALEGK